MTTPHEQADELLADAEQNLRLSRHNFQNFHRNLCARFGYPHDETFWWRDLISLEEHIAKMVTMPESKSDIDRIFATAPELQYLAPEDYELPTANPADVVTHNPHTGTPRDERDIASDPAGILIVEPGKPLFSEPHSTSDAALCRRIEALSKDVRYSHDGMSIGTFQIADLVMLVRDEQDALRADLANARALADKLQHLLASKEHECEGVRAHACDGDCKPDLETVPLPDLIRHVALFLDDGQSLTIYGDDTASVQAFGKSFVCNYRETKGVLDATAMLARLEAV